MTNVTPLVSKEVIQEQACEWISRIDRGLTPDERKQLREWVGQGEQYQKALFEMAALWDDLSVMHELSGLFPLAEKLAQEKTSKRRVAFNTKSSLAAAASFFLLCSVFLAWMQWQPVSDKETASHSANQTYSTKVGQQKTISLADGSFVSLNTNSAIEVLMTATERTIILRRVKLTLTLHRILIGLLSFQQVKTKSRR